MFFYLINFRIYLQYYNKYSFYKKNLEEILKIYGTVCIKPKIKINLKNYELKRIKIYRNKSSSTK
jgi:hypothetical protein